MQEDTSAWVHRVFVVRVWSEPSGSSAEPRAVVEEPATGHRLASANLREVDDFIRMRLGAVPRRAG
jgi:hypothetical protein